MNQKHLAVWDRTWARGLRTKAGLKVGKRSCCRKPENLVQDGGAAVCKTCGARHYEVGLVPVSFGLTGRDV